VARTPKLENLNLERTEFPIDVIVETCCHCNLRCTICPYPTLKRPKGIMEFSTFKKIVDEMAIESPSSRLWVAIMGEPLLQWERLVEMLTYAKKGGIENTHVNTNATFLTPNVTQSLLATGVKELLISVDAFTKQTYDQIRVGGDFPTVIKNVEYFLNEKKQRGLKQPAVIMQFIEMAENTHETEQFKKYWLSKGAIVKIRLKFGWGSAVKTEDLEEANIKRDFPCPWLMRTVSIQWDGRFAQCDADYEGTYSPGDIFNQTIKQVWNSELAKRRERHWALDFSNAPCDACKDWSVGRATFYYPEK
jgi:radical SAM protein with 4Fe4S-binding SPASM domain